MSGLHEALEERLASLPVMEYDNGYRVQALPKTELVDLLLMHPAPTQPVDRGALALLLHNENCDCEILEPLGNYQPPHFLEMREKHAAYYGSQADAALALIGGDAK